VVTINALPVLTVPADVAVCVGNEIQLSAQGAESIVWNGTLANGSFITPTDSEIYTAVGTNEFGCESSEEWSIQVNELPMVNAGADVTVCEGSYVEFNAIGATYYVWSNGASNTASLTVYVTEEISVVGTDAFGCQDADTLIVTTLMNENFYFDADGDGFGDLNTLSITCVQPAGYVTTATDCDDANFSINESAAEVCNNADENCNGQIDEGLVFSNYYMDFDLDGFGSTDFVEEACAQPAGYVDNSLDCNDMNFSVNTVAVEICNDIDDDCNGEIDNGLTFATYYVDTDADTFGDPNNMQDFCLTPTELFVSNSEDCDDTNALVNPAATEVWENGIDDDCNPSTSDVSVGELTAIEFNLFPNPAAERITISRSSTEASSIEIFNSLGALVYTSTVFGAQTIIDVTLIPAGYYFVRVNGMSKTFVKF
jgi:hypothetical protein